MVLLLWLNPNVRDLFLHWRCNSSWKIKSPVTVLCSSICLIIAFKHASPIGRSSMLSPFKRYRTVNCSVCAKRNIYCRSPPSSLRVQIHQGCTWHQGRGAFTQAASVRLGLAPLCFPTGSMAPPAEQNRVTCSHRCLLPTSDKTAARLLCPQLQILMMTRCPF